MDYVNRVLSSIKILDSQIAQKFTRNMESILFFMIILIGFVLWFLIYKNDDKFNSLTKKLKIWKKEKNSEDSFVKAASYYGDKSFYSILRCGETGGEKVSMSERDSFLNPMKRVEDNKAGFLDFDEDEDLRNFLENLEIEEEEKYSEFARSSWKTEGKSSVLERHF